MQVGFPLIYAYSAKVQLSIISSLLVISYLNRRARLVIASLAAVYLAFKVIVPLVGWLVYLFKGVAWFGFYIYFFQKAIQYAISAVDYMFSDGLEALIRELDKRDRNGR
ncbi:hypothetical protein BDN70DRAFT_881358 [Pholiota conissans]|uniref:Uncharacterized protein n=1 Tax=Pholiota conissans TaxID=109636 RepID=A0A9P6CYG3_9AGAR|nr:hypothetical protein BDN70DRAFT_881358 [Pholiota conissans]